MNYSELAAKYGGTIKPDYSKLAQKYGGVVKESGETEGNITAFQGQPEVGPIKPGKSISTLTGKAVTEGEMLRGGGQAGTERFVRPTLEMGGLIGGAAVGAGVGPAGSVAGGGLGYAGGKGIADKIYGESGTLGKEFIKAGEDIATGAALEAGGQIAGVAVPAIARGVGKVAKPVIGRLTGTGKGAVDEAISAGRKAGANPLKSASGFDEALRGKISGEEIVGNAKDAVAKMRDVRAQEYTSRLEKIKINPQKLDRVAKDLNDTLRKLISSEKFDIKPVRTGKGIDFDFSKSTLVEGQPVVKKALQDIAGWTDKSAKGLDALKRRLSTYSGQAKRGTPAESFLTQLEKTVANGLKREVPGYGEMTKGYAEATNLIKDIESGLMLRRQGMTGRIVADQTLRRLMSSMKDNFALRKDLVTAMSGGEELSSQIAGYTMRSYVPVGLAGTGPALIGNAALAQLVSPAFYPVLAASSPRLSAEFLRMVGKTMATFEGTPGLIARQALVATNKQESK